MAVNGAGQWQASVALGGGQPNFELMFAPLLIGVVLNALLFGVFIVQVHSFFRLYKTGVHPPVSSSPLAASRDFGWIRYLIYYLILMEVINTVCDVGLIYEPLITLHNSPSILIDAPRLFAADPIVTTLISTPTQLFMAWRIRRLTRSNWLSGVVALLAFASLVGGIAATIGVATNREFSQFTVAGTPLTLSLTLWLTSSAFADLFITAFLVNFLLKNQTGFKTQTDSVTDKIIFFTMQTGMLTSLAAIVDVSLFLILPRTTLMFIWDFSLSKLYSICLVATLNARHEWNELLEEIPSVSLDKKANKDGSRGKPSPNAIIKLKAATDVYNLQLYIPSQFEASRSSTTSPSATRRRTPTARRGVGDGWIPLVAPEPIQVSAKSTASHQISSRNMRYGDGEEFVFGVDGIKNIPWAHELARAYGFEDGEPSEPESDPERERIWALEELELELGGQRAKGGGVGEGYRTLTAPGSCFAVPASHSTSSATASLGSTSAYPSSNRIHERNRA
ncbi:hypothetical protein C8R44DRAFT_984969 [Mycena epipterygia]|nr:hypothetical protein C8R44DRAFT_984969 [Mycena epipterygia]